MIWFKK